MSALCRVSIWDKSKSVPDSNRYGAEQRLEPGAMSTPGILMRLLEPSDYGQFARQEITSESVSTKIRARYVMDLLEGSGPSRCILYILDDINPITVSAAAYEGDLKATASEAATVSWIVCSFINGRDKSKAGLAPTQDLPRAPALKSTIVINGSTPRPDKEQDYHDWYDQEHGGKLTLVPGWNAVRRYRLAKAYGSVETASFYGVNFYDEENGLGGPEWKASVTEWSLRIRSNAAKPNLRRVWGVIETPQEVGS
jgi:hypothetical protein